MEVVATDAAPIDDRSRSTSQREPATWSPADARLNRLDIIGELTGNERQVRCRVSFVAGRPAWLNSVWQFVSALEWALKRVAFPVLDAYNDHDPASPDVLRFPSLLTALQIAKVLRDLHSDTVDALVRVIDKYDPMQSCIGHIMQGHIAIVRDLLASYAPVFGMASAALQHVLDDASDDDALLRVRASLGAPLTRLPFYELALRRLLTLTPEGHPDAQDLSAAVERARDATTTIADRVEAARQRQLVQSAASRTDLPLASSALVWAGDVTIDYEDTVVGRQQQQQQAQDLDWERAATRSRPAVLAKLLGDQRPTLLMSPARNLSCQLIVFDDVIVLGRALDQSIAVDVFDVIPTGSAAVARDPASNTTRVVDLHCADGRLYRIRAVDGAALARALHDTRRECPKLHDADLVAPSALVADVVGQHCVVRSARHPHTVRAVWRASAIRGVRTGPAVELTAPGSATVVVEFDDMDKAAAFESALRRHQGGLSPDEDPYCGRCARETGRRLLPSSYQVRCQMCCRRMACAACLSQAVLLPRAPSGIGRAPTCQPCRRSLFQMVVRSGQPSLASGSTRTTDDFWMPSQVVEVPAANSYEARRQRHNRRLGLRSLGEFDTGAQKDARVLNVQPRHEVLLALDDLRRTLQMPPSVSTDERAAVVVVQCSACQSFRHGLDAQGHPGACAPYCGQCGHPGVQSCPAPVSFLGAWLVAERQALAALRDEYRRVHSGPAPGRSFAYLPPETPARPAHFHVIKVTKRFPDMLQGHIVPVRTGGRHESPMRDVLLDVVAVIMDVYASLLDALTSRLASDASIADILARFLPALASLFRIYVRAYPDAIDGLPSASAVRQVADRPTAFLHRCRALLSTVDADTRQVLSHQLDAGVVALIERVRARYIMGRLARALAVPMRFLTPHGPLERVRPPAPLPDR